VAENRDLFGRPIIDPMKADQLPLFHEPVELPPPAMDKTDARIARKFRNTPTGELFPKPQDKRTE
jgi:hypothetical protein